MAHPLFQKKETLMNDPYEMKNVEEALETVLSNVSCLEAEEVDLLDSLNRVAAEAMVSDCDIAPFDHAAMDGFALRSCDIASACEQQPVSLPVVAEVPAGATFDGALPEGACIRIMTGAAVPSGADAVVKYEIVEYGSGDGREGSVVSFTHPASSGENVREKGEEARVGQAVIEAGEIIGAAGVGFLAGCGLTKVKVHRRPRVGVIAIGSELVDPSEPLVPGCIRDSNTAAISALVSLAGGVVESTQRVADDPDALAAAVKKACRDCDFVVTSGGASNGDYDFIKPVIEREGSLLMTLVDMRPGKAQTFGIVDATPVFGLPGNPAAAYCGFEVLVRQALRKMQGYRTFARPTVSARLMGDRKKKDPRRIYLRGSLAVAEDGSLVAMPVKNQSSGLFSTLQRANCLIVLPEGRVEGGKVLGGEMVECVLLDVEEGTVVGR